MAEGNFSIVSPDGRFIVYQKILSSGNGDLLQVDLFQVDTNDGREKQLTDSAATENRETFSPDGKTLVFTRFGERIGLWKMPGAGGDATLILDENAICSAISPDGKTVAFIWRRSGNPPSIALVSIDGGEIINTFDTKPEKKQSHRQAKSAMDGERTGHLFRPAERRRIEYLATAA